MNDLADEPAVKKEEEGGLESEVMEGIEGVEEKALTMGKISNSEIQALLNEIASVGEKQPNHQDAKNIKLEHSLLTKANETVARINLEIANIYKV
jgi:hypothetical protein